MLKSASTISPWFPSRFAARLMVIQPSILAVTTVVETRSCRPNAPAPDSAPSPLADRARVIPHDHRVEGSLDFGLRSCCHSVTRTRVNSSYRTTGQSAE